jgi:hypothetical protein
MKKKRNLLLEAFNLGMEARSKNPKSLSVKVELDNLAKEYGKEYIQFNRSASFLRFINKWRKIYRGADVSQWADVMEGFEMEFRNKFSEELNNYDMLIGEYLRV